MKRTHRMPFGAEIGPNGVRFALWAPDAGAVELLIEGEAPQPMNPAEGGWFRFEAPEVAAGAAYRFRVDGGLAVPDPASRGQLDDVHGPSVVVDAGAFEWEDQAWGGRPWEEAVFYELHVGAFTRGGTFEAAIARLDELVDLGVTAVELMPVADFPGRRGWGYDGVLPFAPDLAYGAPDDLKRLVQAAHQRGLMIFLDVVYNHFGPDGNYLNAYAKRFFTDRHHTPWGDAINFDGPGCETVREFFIHNALYWLNEYHFDGLRLDAVHAILDAGEVHFLDELAARLRAALGRGRHVHLVLENDDNAARFLGPDRFDAQWNDDAHHVLHALSTGEDGGYYEDYRDDRGERLGRVLTEGFDYQGAPSPHRGGARRGERSAHLPATAFVNFLQNHDQIGNRALGERIGHLAQPEALRAATAVLLLAPSPPLLFMGQEWAAAQPFLYFCDFADALADAVREGRRREFATFPAFRDAKARERIPDPNGALTFETCKLNWADRNIEPHRAWLSFHKQLLYLRRTEIVPRLAGMAAGGEARAIGPHATVAAWRLGDGCRLRLRANLGAAPAAEAGTSGGRLLFATARVPGETMPPWYAEWTIEGENA
ncbi:MAG: malto-oligosyltrehalose trehalohydrolase [Alphaproteobacteria bacterium]|nr:malto-oligosyltrehalose trehalohydrolase [Alphaproteobacteria bacterium]